MEHPAAQRRAVRSRTVLHVMPDLQIGGGQTIVLQGLRHLPSERYRHVVATLDTGRNDMADAFRAAGAEVVEMGTGVSPRSVLSVRSLIKTYDVDVLHTHSDDDRKVAQLAALTTRTPVVGHLHAEWVHLGPMALASDPRWRRVKSRAAATVRDGIERRTVRHYVAESTRVRDLFAPLVEQPLAVLQQAVPVDRYVAARGGGARARIRAELGIAPGETMLLDVSRLVEGKGQHDLFPVLAQLRGEGRRMRLVLVGDGDLRPALEAAASDLGVADDVMFTGNRTDVPEVMVAADLFVFPSYSEGFGMVALEAMAAGLPVVAYDLPPFHEFMLVGRTAQLVDVGDVDAFTAAVRALLDDPGRAADMGTSAADHVARRYPPDSVASVFASVYDAVLDPRGTP